MQASNPNSLTSPKQGLVGSTLPLRRDEEDDNHFEKAHQRRRNKKLKLKDRIKISGPKQWLTLFSLSFSISNHI
jgi:hypothetical protein